MKIQIPDSFTFRVIIYRWYFLERKKNYYTTNRSPLFVRHYCNKLGTEELSFSDETLLISLGETEA